MGEGEHDTAITAHGKNDEDDFALMTIEEKDEDMEKIEKPVVDDTRVVDPPAEGSSRVTAMCSTLLTPLIYWLMYLFQPRGLSGCILTSHTSPLSITPQ